MEKPMGYVTKKDKLVLVLLTLFVMTLLLGVVYLTLTYSNRDQAYQTGVMLIDQVRGVLASNEKKEQSLVDSLKENYIAKAKAVSYIIDNVPGTETDIAEQIRIASLMSIDEIHIFDETGRIYAGTVPPYYGYTFDSGEQMAYFKPMLTNKALSMCQDVTPNTAEGKSMMYAICWSDTGKRMIQIGIEPRRLIEEMRTNEISDVIEGMPSYDGVDIIVAQSDTGEVIGSTMPNQVGNTLENLGLTPDESMLFDAVHFQRIVANRKSYCSARQMNDYSIVVVQDRGEVDRDVPLVLLMVFVYLMLSAILITLIVGRMAKHILAERINANTDPMTGFFNRRAYENDIAKLAALPREENLVYVSIDLNGLKAANDNLGHEAGDKLICGAAECMEDCFGRNGKLYRIGGDEFVALIVCDEERLKKLLQGYTLSQKAWSENNDMELSTACGYVRASEFPNKSMTELAKLADERMYEAKSEHYRANGLDRRKR